MKPGSNLLAIAAVFTVVVTFYSLSELHKLSSATQLSDSRLAAHADWKTIAERAVLHVEELPLKFAHGHAQHGHPIAGVPAQGQASSSGPVATGTPAVVVQPAVTTTTQVSSASPAPTASTTGKTDKCYQYPHTELWGDVVVWGSSHKVPTAAACCDACRNYKPKSPEDPDCNVWVWGSDEHSPTYTECWLKHLAHPSASKPARQGDEVPWTAGTVGVDLEDDGSRGSGAAGGVDHESRRFHTVTSAQGSAVHWQARVHYYWWKKQKAVCEAAGGCEMGGFTRLLHSGAADDLMSEIPTMVVDQLPKSMVDVSWYVVLNRPYAFAQWVKRANIPEKYVLMAEPDHVFLRPMPNFMKGEVPAAFPFFYIEPAKKDFVPITEKFTGPLTRKELESIAPIGNSPTFLSLKDMAAVMPIWMNTSIAIFKDADANKAWGWVQEMYGFTIAVFKAGIPHVDLHLHMMSQPPWDTRMNITEKKPFHILHYTYGMDYKLSGEHTPGKFGEWRFDKRTYAAKPPPRHLGDPPRNMRNDLVRFLIDAINEASAALPCWDEYAQTGRIPTTCNEQPKVV